MRKIFLAACLPLILLGKEYDFEEILSKTLANNKELKAKKMSLEIAKARVKDIGSKKFGEVTVNENFYRTNHSGYVFNAKLSSREVTDEDMMLDMMNEPKSRNNFETTAEYKIPLFTGFMLSNEESAAKNMEKAALYIANRDEKKISIEALKGYNYAVAAKRYLSAAQKSYESVERIVYGINEMFKQKMASKTDLMEAELAKTTADARLFEAKKQYQTSIEYLKFIADEEDISGVGSFFEVQSSAGNYENRDELKATEFAAEASKKRSDATISEHLPKVYAFAKYGYNDDVLTLSGTKDFYFAGIAVSYSLTDFGGASARREAARAEYLKASYEAASMKGYAKFDAKQKELEMEQKEKLVAQSKAKRELASQIFENYKLKHQNGLTSVTELLKKEAESLVAEAEEIEAKAMYLNAKAEYKYAVGLGIKD